MKIFKIKYSEFLCLSNIFWRLIIFALVACCTCCSFMRPINEFRPQTQNGWSIFDYPTASSNPRQVSRYSNPAVFVTISDNNYYFFIGPTFIFPIIPVPNIEGYYTLLMVFDNSEDNIEIDIRGIKISRSNGETMSYDSAFYCNAPDIEFVSCQRNNRNEVTSGKMALSKGKYIFELTFSGSMSSGTSVIDFSDVSFNHKKNQLPPLLISKQTRIRYCPLNPVCFEF